MKYTLLIIFSGLLLHSCATQSSLTAYCEKDAKGNYILRWDLYPDLDSVQVDIYVSDNDKVFPPSPSVVTNSNDYIAIIKKVTEASPTRKFFKIRVGNILSDVITNRFFELDSIQNFRDIGGYATNDSRRVRWGMIFRSGALSRMTDNDALEIKNLGVKTIIDLRSKDSQKPYNNQYKVDNYYRLPIGDNGYSSISKKILDGRFLRGDAIIFTQDSYRDMINNFAEEFATFFDYLCDEKNYPIIYHCYLGKDQSGLATYFLLKALDVPDEIIEDDYMSSRTGIDKSKIVKGADSLSERRQEALTMMTKTDLANLRYGLACVREKSGSIEDYMLKELKITPEKKKKLKGILLY